MPKISDRHHGRRVASLLLNCVTVHKFQDLSEPALPAVTEALAV